MKVKFDLEGSDDSAIFALYAGLRMYKELKDAQPKPEGAFSIPAAEANCMLEDLKKQHPKEYAECVAEYNEVYGSVQLFTEQALRTVPDEVPT